jgi:hypothetical protein
LALVPDTPAESIVTLMPVVAVDVAVLVFDVQQGVLVPD